MAALLMIQALPAYATSTEDSAVVDDGSASTQVASVSQDQPSSGDSASDLSGLFEVTGEHESNNGSEALADSKSGKAQKKQLTQLIVGYQKVGPIQSISFEMGQKPTISTLQEKFPKTLGVYFLGDKEVHNVSVSWVSYDADYSATDNNYYLFTPKFDSGKYGVKGMNLQTQAPYIEVRKNALAVEMIASAPPTVNEKKIFDYCTGQLGLNKAAACGILANLYCESDFRTNAIGDSGTSVGICQWHNGRWSNLKSFTPGEWQTLEGQLRFMSYELRNGYRETLRHLRGVTEDASGAYDAAYFWCMHYEMPDNTVSRSITRAYLAKNIYWPRYGEPDEGTDDCDCNASFAGEYRCSSDDGLVIRSAHSTDSEKAGFIEPDAVVQVSKGNGEWAHVSYHGVKGYCSMEYLTPADVKEDNTQSAENEAETEGSSGVQAQSMTEQDTEG